VETYSLNTANPVKSLTEGWVLTVPSNSSFRLYHLVAASAAMTVPDFREFFDASLGEVILRRHRSDVDTLSDLYAFDALPDLDALAEAQGVSPTTDTRDLATNDWPEDESVEDFIAAAMEGRYEEDDLAL
jgi:hypothetical protein